MNFIEEIIKNDNLPNVGNFRFPPEPNKMDIKNNKGGLHIGHAKSVFLNYGLAEKYNTECFLRFDDTNPLSESSEAEAGIIKDIKWLIKKEPIVKRASDNFEFIYKCAVKLIENGLAYIDFSTSEEIANGKGTPVTNGTPNKYRSYSIEDNLKIFNDMYLGKYKEGEVVLRAKIDLNSPNMIMRDPILYRIISKEHHTTKDKWRIYPMYDFAHPICDYLEDIKYSLCTLEFEVHRPLYEWVLEKSELSGPRQIEFARLNLEYALTSKRKIKELIESNVVSDISDPRLFSIAALKRRGYTADSLKNFCEKISVTKNNSLTSIDLLEECLRDDLNKSSKRFMGVFDPIKLTLVNYSGSELLDIENNPEDTALGNRKVSFSSNLLIERDDYLDTDDKKWFRLKPGGLVRLKGAYIIACLGVNRNEMGDVVEVLAEYIPETKSGLKTDIKAKGTIHWIDGNNYNEFILNEFSYLFKDKDNFGELNDASIVKSKVLIEKITLPEEETFQLIRKGYYITDSIIGEINKTIGIKSSTFIKNFLG